MMLKFLRPFAISAGFWSIAFLVVAESLQAAEARSRIFVLTDISNEPDDEESLVRFLVYSNEYDIEGLVATTSTWLRKGTREDLIRRQIDAYAKVYENLSKHQTGFPTSDHLRSVTTTGQPNYGMAAVGADKMSPGAKLLIDAADRGDDRPLWVSVWGGANTLAQALLYVKENRSAEALDDFVGRLRVYTISDQDDSGPWIRKTFPQLFYIVSPSTAGGEDYHWATWTGISGDKFYENGPGYKMELVSKEWLKENVAENHGPLGALYPMPPYIMEGDTPSFLGLINNGLGWNESPAYGGWGGRYALYQPLSESRKIWTNNRNTRDKFPSLDTIQVFDTATISRWREHYQNDFAARMDWCVKSEYSHANHNPIAILNGDESKQILKISAKPGDSIKLDAMGTKDPDQNNCQVKWWIYPELKSYPGSVKLEQNEGMETTLVLEPNENQNATGDIHVIMEVSDDGAPALWSYRRAIVHVDSK